MTMSKGRVPKIGKSKATLIDKNVDWGLYFWKLPNGHLFVNEDGDPLNIPARKGDIRALAEIQKAAAYYGQPEGSPWFYAGIRRASEETYSEQVDRMKQGLIPNLNDMGAVWDAQQTLKKYGDQG